MSGYKCYLEQGTGNMSVGNLAILNRQSYNANYLNIIKCLKVNANHRHRVRSEYKFRLRLTAINKMSVRNIYYLNEAIYIHSKIACGSANSDPTCSFRLQ